MINPLVAIILVNFNNKNDTEECIESLLKENYDNKKIIVVDNGSKDGSITELKRQFENKVIFIENQDNLGFSCANNQGIELALKENAQYIMLLNNDTVVEQEFIKPMLEVAERKNCIVSPKIPYYDEKNILWSCGGEFRWKKGTTHNRGINEVDNGQFDEEKEVDFASGCCLFIPRKILETVGMLSDEYFLYYEDTDYCLKAKHAGFKIVYTPKAVVYHKVSRTMGGAESPTVLYYSNRNRLYFNDKYNKQHKHKFLLYFYGTRMVKISLLAIKGEKDKVSAIKEGIYDYKRRKIGKRA
ncbi:glycosyltransferase family 2 protein [Clostridium cellulovorans]|uniref:Glycosyl transferase family 2 n=2 Tax=Clostridium cellulovorans TaxID=1493 RepID=D9SRL7_CLOC7|nr:glycosyltransferase family 2 protein [Clostridium cellulovorans]ADL50384.1 glycosyl transferase family 2 [Clostridium cellulovorans 743B]BAV13139.1 glycosyl transferase family protein [Clostridium cellulovorans]